MSMNPRIAYFSMEIALDERFATYSGGLGILAGDTLRSAADVGVPMVAVTLAYPNGYFRQHLGPDGRQHELPDVWSPAAFCRRTDARVSLRIDGRDVHLGAWEFDVVGVGGHVVRAYLLDSDLAENAADDRTLTATLYGGDARYRLAQEMILGIGGCRLLAALGYDASLDTYHMNEGHAALIALELLERRPEPLRGSLASVREHCVFTTHTPIPAGHDRFDATLVRRQLGDEGAARLTRLGLLDGELNMTHLALASARFVNGVAMRHAQVSREMFPGHEIAAITNGVHAATWVAPPFAQLFDREIPQWRRDNGQLRHAVGLSLDDLLAAHHNAKTALFAEVTARTGVVLDPAIITLGFARRATAYKRADWLFHDHERLRALVARVGKLQVVYGGKAHPHDEPGKAGIRRVHEASAALADVVDVVYVPNYDMSLAKYLVTGVDIWLNNPQPPLEASGTSGMKAALNGIPSLSVLDGWWIEGCVEGRTGWAIDEVRDEAIYEALERAVMQLRSSPLAYAEMMRDAIAVNGSFFNTQRMVEQYVRLAYDPGASALPIAV